MRPGAARPGGATRCVPRTPASGWSSGCAADLVRAAWCEATYLGGLWRGPDGTEHWTRQRTASPELREAQMNSQLEWIMLRERMADMARLAEHRRNRRDVRPTRPRVIRLPRHRVFSRRRVAGSLR